MRRVISSVFEGILNIFLVVMLLVNFYNIVDRNVNHTPMAKLFGIGYAIVVSGSMEPEISVNDVVYLKEQDSYKVGDIITFVDFAPGQYVRTKDTPLVTHRIVDISATGQYITKGDANNTQDEVAIPADRIEGRIFAVLPYIGKSVTFMTRPIGTLWLMLLALLLIELPYLVRSKKKPASDVEIQTFMSKLRPASANGAPMPPDATVEDDPNQLLLAGMLPRKRKERAPYVPPKEEKRHRFSKKPKVYVPEEGKWNID